MKRFNVLCAMRDSRVTDSLRRALGERCAFRFASSGEAALSACGRLTPDVLIIDAVLPYVDGLGVIDSLRMRLGERMPVVIGGSVMGFSDGEFARRGVTRLAHVPWDADGLGAQLTEVIRQLDTQVDWARARKGFERASVLLARMGMNERLHGFAYLAWAAALAYEDEERLYAIGERIYAPIAQRLGTTRPNVERLIRHAVESTMDAVGPDGVYGFFGNTIDPTRGKPTNAQMIGMLVQRLRVEKG